MSAALIGDIGATNARFAVLRDGEPEATKVLQVAAFPSLGDAIQAYLSALPAAGLPMPDRAALAVAGPVTGDMLSFTNHPWSFSISELKQRFGFHRLDVLNDFVALALAVPHLGETGRRQIGSGEPAEGAPIGIIGPGTGLGVSILVPVQGGGKTHWIPIASEGGHVTLPSVTAREAAIVDALHAAGRTHVSAETLICGQGLVTLYETLAIVDGATSDDLKPADVTRRALEGRDPRATEAVAIFCALLGTVAGNLALTGGTRGGVFIAGGIVPRLGELFDQSDFRERFLAKGRMRSFLEPIPTYLITQELAAFPGLAALVRGS